MLSKKMQDDVDQITKISMDILKMSGGYGKDYKETYERAQATLGMLDIGVRMLISELEQIKASKNNSKQA